jgi:hypothetical protein
MRGATMWIIFLLFWYVPFISRAFWTGVYTFAAVLGANPQLVALGFQRFQFWRL